jgi:hypothetical protein
LSLHVHLCGKTGELLYLSGCLPALRARWPGHSIVLHLHPHYAPLVAGLRHQPDAVEILRPLERSKPLAVQVTDLTRAALLRHHRPLTREVDGDWHVLPYGLHQAAAGGAWRHPEGKRLGFWELFQAAADAEAYPYDRPSWGKPRGLAPDVAVVFASGNLHTGGARTIDLPPAEWDRLAAELRAFGVAPVATGHRDDPRPLMPGWDWLNTDDPRDVLELLASAGAVVGLNSGITWSAFMLAPGRVTMFDTQEGPGVGRMYRAARGYETGLLDPMRHLQVSWRVAAEDMTAAVRRALLR